MPDPKAEAHLCPTIAVSPAITAIPNGDSRAPAFRRKAVEDSIASHANQAYRSRTAPTQG